ncbi:MAG: chromate efflux transporter [Bacteroidia bacterium]
MTLPSYSVSQIKRFIYLKEIFFISVTGFGGPGAHLNSIIKHLVNKRQYLTKAELLELHSFCQMLPGPTSTQMITSLGYQIGGPLLAFTALLIWILPATLLMTGFVVAWHFIGLKQIPMHFLSYIHPMAVAFIAGAAIKVFLMIQKKTLYVILYGMGTVGAIVFRSPWIFPVLLGIGAVVSHRASQGDFPAYRAKIRPNWRIFILFISILIISAVIGNITQSKPVLLFENSYQYGSIVFGGGNVLIPMMYKQYVTFKGYMGADDFLLGVGLQQAVPGPVFSIATFANGQAMADWGVMGQLLGCLLGTVGIFLPGILMIFFLFPIWDEMKKMPLVRKAIDGITAVSAGLVLAAACLLFQDLELGASNFLVFFVTLLLVMFTKIPSPLIVAATVVFGLIYPA